MTDKDYIDITIEISKTATFPHGAIIVKENKIIGRSDKATLMPQTLFTHAELYAMEDAAKNKNLYGELSGATLYTSCEPCMMCMGAILYEGITKIVYAATLQDSNDFYSPENISPIKELAKYANHSIEIIGEINRDKAIEVLKIAKSKQMENTFTFIEK